MRAPWLRHLSARFSKRTRRAPTRSIFARRPPAALGVEWLEDWTVPAGPKVLSASPLRVDGGALDHFDVRFSMAIDAATLTQDDVTLAGPTGAVPVAGISTLASDLYRITVAP